MLTVVAATRATALSPASMTPDSAIARAGSRSWGTAMPGPGAHPGTGLAATAACCFGLRDCWIAPGCTSCARSKGDGPSPWLRNGPTAECPGSADRLAVDGLTAARSLVDAIHPSG